MSRCTGPCRQGRDACPCPQACQLQACELPAPALPEGWAICALFVADVLVALFFAAAMVLPHI